MPSPREMPRVPFGTLVESGAIKPGDILCPASNALKDATATVLVDGSIELAQSSKLIPLRMGSIHKMGALVQGKKSCNGWQFWKIKRGNEWVLIDDLRTKFIEQNNLYSGRVAER